MVNRDFEHLNILSILFYVLSALVGLGALFFSLYIIIGIFFLSVDIPQKAGDPPPEFIGGFMIVFGLIFVVAFAVISILAFKTARSLKSHTNYTLCFVTAAIACLWVPLGTVLGVFTIVVLLRDSVKALFDGQRVPHYNSPPNWQ